MSVDNDKQPDVAPSSNETPAQRKAREKAEYKERRKEVMSVLWGVMLAMFVAMMSVTIVGTSLPTMMAALHGTETHYTWVVTSMMLSSTVMTPIAGRLADLYDKKKLLLAGIAIFTAGSLLAGAATSPLLLILFRTLQGIGMGMQMSLSQTVIASITSPRDRGRYNGYLGAVMAVSTVSGPLVGGFIVATPWLGWRWSLWISVPFSLLALVILARFLKVPGSVVEKPVIDFAGAITITVGVSLLLIWLSLGGKSIEWDSTAGIVLPILAFIFLTLFVIAERRAVEPIVPPFLLKNRTTVLAIVASIAVGVGMTAPPVFLGQYFQIGRGLNPAIAGLAMTPLMIGSFIFSTIVGQWVSRAARWKPFVIGGMLVMTAGMVMMSFADADSSYWFVWVAIFAIGAGQGASMQNLVLAVQNTVRLRDIGASTATVTFFRSLGGAIGVQAAGIAFSWDINQRLAQEFKAAGMSMPASHDGSMNFDALPEAARSIVQTAYGDSIGIIFLTMAVGAIIGLVAVIFMRGSRLRETIDAEQKQVHDLIEAAAGREAGRGGAGEAGGGAGAGRGGEADHGTDGTTDHDTDSEHKENNA